MSVRRGAQVVVAFGILLIFVYAFLDPQRFAASPAEQCRKYYASARTLADTAFVDARQVWAGRHIAPFRCGELRRANFPQ